MKREIKILRHGRIERYNCIGLCEEETCDRRQTHFIKLDLGGFKVFIPLCKKHYQKALIQSTWREEGWFEREKDPPDGFLRQRSKENFKSYYP